MDVSCEVRESGWLCCPCTTFIRLCPPEPFTSQKKGVTLSLSCGLSKDYVDLTSHAGKSCLVPPALPPAWLGPCSWDNISCRQVLSMARAKPEKEVWFGRESMGPLLIQENESRQQFGRVQPECPAQEPTPRPRRAATSLMQCRSLVSDTWTLMGMGHWLTECLADSWRSCDSEE